MVAALLSWIGKELKAQRITGGGAFIKSSDATQARVTVHEPDDKETKKQVAKLLEPQHHPPTPEQAPAPKTTITAVKAVASSPNLQRGVKHDSMDTVIEWLEGCPLYGDGLSFEIR